MLMLEHMQDLKQYVSSELAYDAVQLHTMSESGSKRAHADSVLCSCSVFIDNDQQACKQTQASLHCWLSNMCMLVQHSTAKHRVLDLQLNGTAALNFVCCYHPIE